MAAIAPTTAIINIVMLGISVDVVGVAFGVAFPGGGVVNGVGAGGFGVGDCLFVV
jgi:hypothetical protein